MNGKLPVTNGCISLQSSVVPRREHQHCCKNGHCAWSKQRWSDLYLSAETLAKSAKLFMLCIWGLQIKHMYILYILYVHNGGGGSLYIHIYVYIAFPKGNIITETYTAQAHLWRMPSPALDECCELKHAPQSPSSTD